MPESSEQPELNAVQEDIASENWNKRPHPTSSVAAIIVTFHPDQAVLQEAIAALKTEGASIVVVDNTPVHMVKPWQYALSDNNAVVHLEFLGRNHGIARAQNIGIEWVRQQGFEYVLLLDHDSVPQPGMLIALIEEIAKVHRPAAVGPRFVDDRQQNPPPFIQVRGVRTYRYTCESSPCALPVDYLIASGSLIPMATLDAVGGMREDFFIDYVDIEWGLRANRRGFQCYGVCRARMRHSLGDEPVRLYKRSISIHSPLRHYYQFRNAILLYKCGWVPLNWRLVDAWKLLLRFGFYTIFAKPHMQHWKMILLGLIHGLLNRGGELK